MTVQECYAQMNGDYAGVLARFGNEERVCRFLLKFQKDPCFDDLCAAFRAVHSLKGIGMNQGLTGLTAAWRTAFLPPLWPFWTKYRPPPDISSL